MSRYIKQILPDTEPFFCIQCGFPVQPPISGTSQRNHCPYCLWSRHMDLSPGDRRSACRQAMEPISIWVKPDGEWSIIHRCSTCGFLRHNRLSGDDDERMLLGLALKAQRSLAFGKAMPAPIEKEAGYGA